MTKESGNVGLTTEQFQQLLSELRKPLVTESDAAKMRAEAEERARNAQTVKDQIEARRLGQKLCTHMRRDGTTCCVPAQDDGGPLLLCQRCQAIIRNGHQPAGYDGMDHYDPELFNRLFQLAQPEIFG